MSLFHDDVDHLMKWVRETGLRKDADGNTFLKRMDVARYIKYTFDEYLTIAHKKDIKVNLVKEEVLSVTLKGVQNIKTNSCSKSTDAIVFCVGNAFKDIYPQLRGLKKFFESPYPEEKIQDKSVISSKKIGIIGSKLSAIDAIMALESEGYTGKYMMCSRNGLFPAVKQSFDAVSSDIIKIESIESLVRRGKTTRQALFTLTCKALQSKGMSRRDIFSLIAVVKEKAYDVLGLECESTSLSKNKWEDACYSLISVINFAYEIMNEKERVRFLRKDMPVYLRYISAFPVENARVIWDLVRCGRLEIRNGLKFISHEKGLFYVEVNDEIIICDTLICATGMKISPQSESNNSIGLLLSNLSKWSDGVLFDEKCRLRKSGCYDVDVFGTGVLTSDCRAITNSAIVCAEQAHEISKQILEKYTENSYV